ncbi:hypothetical protein B0J14DRAFT_465103 [Halenospora varia]|nr:hypothetical protein B0J14DRAFT_465103 [Halenospora varia]
MAPEPSLTHLSDVEKKIYETLVNVVQNRRKPKPKVVVITDLAKDYDDLAAMMVLKELHRLDIVEILGFIANLSPAEKRTRFGRGALDSLDLNHVPIARGTSGFPEKGDKKHDEMGYEFDVDFMADPDDPKLAKYLLQSQGAGQDLLEKLCRDAITKGEKFTLLLISSLEDVFKFSENHGNLLKDAVSDIVLQGGYYISEDGKLKPDNKANNNKYDWEAAEKFHTFMQENGIPSSVYTKTAVFACKVDPRLFDKLATTKQCLGRYLQKVNRAQNLEFYRSACQPEGYRFDDDKDQVNFLRTRTTYFDFPHSPNEPYPVEEEIFPYLKVVVYDALAALGTAGADVLQALDVLDVEIKGTSQHRIFGIAGPPPGVNGPPEHSGIHPKEMALALEALLKGSILFVKSKELPYKR